RNQRSKRRRRRGRLSNPRRGRTANGHGQTSRLVETKRRDPATCRHRHEKEFAQARARAAPGPALSAGDRKSDQGSGGRSAMTSSDLVQPFIAAMQIFALALMLMHHSLSVGVLANLLLSIPALIAGVVLGIFAFRHVSEQIFRRLILLILLVSGLLLVA